MSNDFDDMISKCKDKMRESLLRRSPIAHRFMREDLYSHSRVRRYRKRQCSNIDPVYIKFDDIKLLHSEVGWISSYTTSHGILLIPHEDRDFPIEGSLELEVLPSNYASNTWIYWSGKLDI